MPGNAGQSGIERGILVAISRSDGLSFADLVDGVHAGRSTVAFHLKYLTASGLVAAEVGPDGRLRYSSPQRELILRLYNSFKDSFEDRWTDEFSSVWGGLVRD